MLVLQRLVGESIIIGGKIKVEVIRIKEGKVRLGVKAPRDVSVHREEVQKLIERRRAEAEADAGADAGPPAEEVRA